MSGSGSRERLAAVPGEDPAADFRAIADAMRRAGPTAGVPLRSERAQAALIRARAEAALVRAGLSDREREVLRRVIAGESPEETAAALRISRRTVKFHLVNALRKLGAESQFDLLRVLS